MFSEVNADSINKLFTLLDATSSGCRLTLAATASTPPSVILRLPPSSPTHR